MTKLALPGAPQPLGTLLRKAAVDAGFDLEPELEGSWWRLRSTAVSGVAWVQSLTGSSGAALALPVWSQLAGAAAVGAAEPDGLAAAGLPAGAAGMIRLETPAALEVALRHVRTARATDPVTLRERWDAGFASAMDGAGSPAIVPVTSGQPLVTEAMAEVRRRVGQGIYRDALLDLWEGRCAVTGLAVPELLRASHAKPWAVATDVERMDVYNGLLLAVHLDALFDQGFLTFEDDGRGVLSPVLAQSAAAIVGVDAGDLLLRRVDPGHLPYLAWHRDNIFRSSSQS